MALLKAHAWPVAAAIVVGFALLPLVQREYESWAEAREHERQRSLPVVTMAGKMVARDEVAVFVHIAGTKHRECKFLGLMAYAVNAAGVRRDANIERVDGVTMRGETKQPGQYDIGVWRVWPVSEDAASAVVLVEHACDGVSVRSVIAEVTL